MVARYFLLLAAIVRCAPNMQHLSVASLETNDISFWNRIVHTPSDIAPSGPILLAVNGFRNLQTLCVQLHTKGYGLGRDAASFRRICSAMTSVSSLVDFRASGVMTTEFLGPDLSNGAFKSLQRLELIECVLDIEEVVYLWSACKGLRHINCVWSYLTVYAEATLSDLYPGLLPHIKTLETLHLDFREVRWDYEHTTTLLLLGTLQPFERLERLIVSQTGLLAHDTVISGSSLARPRGLLPVDLKTLVLLLNESEKYSGWLDRSYSMKNLYEDCKASAPSLRNVVVKCPSPPSPAPYLTADFAEIGVLLTLGADY
jgi:hypothetical protein